MSEYDDDDDAEEIKTEADVEAQLRAQLKRGAYDDIDHALMAYDGQGDDDLKEVIISGLFDALKTFFTKVRERGDVLPLLALLHEHAEPDRLNAFLGNHRECCVLLGHEDGKNLPDPIVVAVFLDVANEITVAYRAEENDLAAQLCTEYATPERFMDILADEIEEGGEQAKASRKDAVDFLAAVDQLVKERERFPEAPTLATRREEIHLYATRKNLLPTPSS